MRKMVLCEKGLREVMNVRVVIFDMFETLISYHTCPVYFGAQMAEDAGIPVAEFLSKWRATDYDRSTGKHTVEEVLEQILKEFDCYSEEILQELVGKRYATIEACLKHKDAEIIPMLQAIKEQGVLIGLISNCYLEEATRIRESELFPYFDAVFFLMNRAFASRRKRFIIAVWRLCPYSHWNACMWEMVAVMSWIPQRKSE